MPALLCPNFPSAQPCLLGLLPAGKNCLTFKSYYCNIYGRLVGFAPVEDPEVALAVRIANGYGSPNATAVGKHIFNYYFGLESWEEIITGEASQAFNTRTD